MPQPRKSDAEHALHGSVPHDRAADISHVPAGRPKVPKAITEAGLRAPFKKLCRLLQERRNLTSADVELVSLYCFIRDRYERNLALLRTEGEICEYTRLDSHGVAHAQLKSNLRLKVCTDAERQLASILNQLGFTPTAKDRAKPTTAREVEDPSTIPGTAAWMILNGGAQTTAPEPAKVAPEEMEGTDE